MSQVPHCLFGHPLKQRDRNRNKQQKWDVGFFHKCFHSKIKGMLPEASCSYLIYLFVCSFVHSFIYSFNFIYSFIYFKSNQCQSWLIWCPKWQEERRKKYSSQYCSFMYIYIYIYIYILAGSVSPVVQKEKWTTEMRGKSQWMFFFSINVFIPK